MVNEMQPSSNSNNNNNNNNQQYIIRIYIYMYINIEKHETNKMWSKRSLFDNKELCSDLKGDLRVGEGWYDESNSIVRTFSNRIDSQRRPCPRMLTVREPESRRMTTKIEDFRWGCRRPEQTPQHPRCCTWISTSPSALLKGENRSSMTTLVSFSPILLVFHVIEIANSSGLVSSHGSVIVRWLLPLLSRKFLFISNIGGEDGFFVKTFEKKRIFEARNRTWTWFLTSAFVVDEWRCSH